MSINGVVLDEQRRPLPINSLERTKLTISPVTLELTTGLGYPGASNSYYARGVITCTNYRLVFVTDPALPLFDSFMVTWNKIDTGFLTSKRPWWMRPFGKLFSTTATTNDATIFECPVHPLEDEPQLVGEATLRITLPDAEQARTLSQLVKDSRWTGHLDPENSAEPPPAYPVSVSPGPPAGGTNPAVAAIMTSSPPPCYEQAVLICNTDPRVGHSAL